MPAINVNPMRPAAWGRHLLPVTCGKKRPSRQPQRRFCGAKAPSPRGGAPLKADGGARRGGVIHARD